MEGFGQFFSSGGGMMMMMFFVIYLFMIRPQLSKAKKEKKFLVDLKSGDRVVMKSGLHGRINHINKKDGTCIIETTARCSSFTTSHWVINKLLKCT